MIKKLKKLSSRNVWAYIYRLNLTWKQRINHIKDKVSKTHGILCKRRHFVPTKIWLELSILHWFTHTIPIIPYQG